MKIGRFVIALLSLFLLLLSQPVFSGPLPKSTQQVLKKLKLDASILSGIDKELEVPKKWIEKAREEGKLKVLGAADATKTKVAIRPFKERYPFIDIDYSHAARAGRTVRTLVGFKSGRILTDVVSSVGGAMFQFKAAGALEDLRSIPGLSNVPEGAKDPNGLWVGIHTKYWCMAYNTKLVKKEDLPKRWEDLLINPRWRGGNLAVGNRPNLWALPLWAAKGEKWTKDFLTRLFTEVKPQLRKEGLNTLPELVAAGEFHMALPTPDSTTYRMVMVGAPVGFVCPEPVPVAVEEVIILKGAHNINAARIYINWVLSKEGQISDYGAGYSTPVHKGLQGPEFIPFAPP